jgi:hypothetical protein
VNRTHRVSLDLDSRQHSSLKRLALRDEKTMAEVLRQLVDLYIKAVTDQSDKGE